MPFLVKQIFTGNSLCIFLALIKAPVLLKNMQGVIYKKLFLLDVLTQSKQIQQNKVT